MYHFSSLFTRIYMQCLQTAQRCQKQVRPLLEPQGIVLECCLVLPVPLLSVSQARGDHTGSNQKEDVENPSFSAALNLVWIPDIERHQ